MSLPESPPGATPMKLADALRHADRIGLPDRRYRYIETFVQKWGGEAPPCCAIGGAAVVTGAWVYDTVDMEPVGRVLTNESAASAQYPNVAEDIWADRRGLRCPVCPGPALTYIDPCIANYVAHLYDEHQWSRSSIAGWLDSLEAAA